MMLILRVAILLLLAGTVAGLAKPTKRENQIAIPTRLSPVSGSFEGGQLAFVEVKEKQKNTGKSSMTCRFGNKPPVQGQFDKKSRHYMCRVPSHPRPESVKVTITLNGKSFLFGERYVYTTHGIQDSPVNHINVRKLQQQVREIREGIPKNVKLCAVLENGNPVGWLGKAMASATKIDYFCVPKVQDGIALRQAGVKAPIMIMNMTQTSYLPLLLHYNLEPAAISLSWVNEVTRRLGKSTAKLNVHLWIDTGFSRDGVMADQALPLARAIHNSSNLHLQGIATHFCCLVEGDLEALKKKNSKNQTVLQKHRFDRVVKAIHAAGIGRNAIVHAGSSDALDNDLAPVYYGMLRIGELLFESSSPEDLNYTWKTRILQIKTLPKGWCLDYGCDEKIKKDTRVGLVGHVPDDEVFYFIRGKKVKKLLDHETVIVLDLSGLANIREGEPVTIKFDEDSLDNSYRAPVTLNDNAGR